MGTAARAGRFGLLLALLLVLLGVSAAVAPRGGDGHPAPYGVAGESVSTSPSAHDDLHDWLRVSGIARATLSTAPPDTRWALCPHATDESAPRGWSLVDEARGAGMVATVTKSRPSRAPPVHVD